MARTRLELQAELEALLGSGNVYYQPPENYKLKYPCLVYELQRIASAHADDLAYKRNPQYQITAIYRDPDSDLPDRLLDLRGARLDRIFTSDNLHHAVVILTIL